MEASVQIEASDAARDFDSRYSTDFLKAVLAFVRRIFRHASPPPL